MKPLRIVLYVAALQIATAALGMRGPSPMIAEELVVIVHQLPELIKPTVALL